MLPKPPYNFGIQSENSYYKKCNLKEKLLFAKIQSDKIFKILKTFDESKALLPLISRVLDKLLHEETMEFLDKHNILYKLQSGFQKNHYTEFRLSYSTDKISKDFDSGLLTGMILIDLQEAFDTIDHNTLPLNMPSLGFLP